MQRFLTLIFLFLISFLLGHFLTPRNVSKKEEEGDLGSCRVDLENLQSELKEEVSKCDDLLSIAKISTEETKNERSRSEEVSKKKKQGSGIVPMAFNEVNRLYDIFFVDDEEDLSSTTERCARDGFQKVPKTKQSP